MTNHSRSLASSLSRSALVVLIALSAFGTQAQTSLTLRLSPTVSVSGPVGTWQQVQYSDDFNTPTNWTFLSNVFLDASPKLVFDTTNAPKRFYRSIQLTNVADTNLVWIPPGTFLMGSPSNEVGRASNEGPQTLVTLTYGFFMGRHEVTETEYLSVTGSNPGQHDGVTNHLLIPITGATWYDASNYCALLTQRELAAFRIPPGWAYRVPTETEWEYACRAGTSTAFHYGNALYANTALGSLANFDGRSPYPPASDPTGIWNTYPIVPGTYAPNAFGLYDMHGNVAEWCLDTALVSGAFPPYPGGSVTNPPAAKGTATIYAIIRGGHYANDGATCRSARRMLFQAVGPAGSFGPFGFRVVLAPIGVP